MSEAARASLRLLDADAAAARRRVVIAVDVAGPVGAAARRPRPRRRAGDRAGATRPRRVGARGRRRRRGCRRGRGRCGHRSRPGDAGRAGLVDDAEGFELSWYANQEIGHLLGRSLNARGAWHDRLMDAITHPPVPRNEPVRTYAPGSSERASLAAALEELAGRTGRADHDDRRRGPDGRRRADRGRAPHRHRSGAGRDPRRPPTPTSRPRSAPPWPRRRRGASCPSTSGPRCSCARPTCSSTTWRDRLNAATMLGQSKTVQQAEIDAACELADFLRFNVHFARQILEEQPAELAAGAGTGWTTGRSRGSCSRSPPSTSPRSPATCRRRRPCSATSWCGSRRTTQQLAAHYTMPLFEAAGLPPGVINMVTGDGAAVSRVALPHPALAGIHFTGSTATFQHLWREVAQRDRVVCDLPAAGRRDRGQGLRGRAPERRAGRRWSPAWCAARSSTRARSARRPRAPTFRDRCGTAGSRTNWWRSPSR